MEHPITHILTADAGAYTYLDELQEHVGVVEELGDDKVRARVHLTLQVRNVLAVVLAHLRRVLDDHVGVGLGVPAFTSVCRTMTGLVKEGSVEGYPMVYRLSAFRSRDRRGELQGYIRLMSSHTFLV
jgi:hypothetical protein